jgi:hypothetical protein
MQTLKNESNPMPSSVLKTVSPLLFCLFSLILLESKVALAQAGDAGKVLLSIGDVKVNRSGQLIPLKKGDVINVGDAIITGATSNAQIRMSDGAVMAIRPQTEFKIAEYSFNGKADGTEKASLSLVKGGVRAVTGTIGRENKDNLKVDAVVATIGIRGTGFNLVYCQGSCPTTSKEPVKNGLYASVFEGKVTVANEATKGVFGTNEPIYVESKNSSISRLREAPAFLKDALAAQIIVPKKADSVVVPIAAPVKIPADSDDGISSANSAIPKIGDVTINPQPQLAAQLDAVVPTQWFNKPGLGSGGRLTPSAGGTPNTFFLQVAETFPGSRGSDGLPVHNITPINNNGGASPTNPGFWGVTVSGSGVDSYVNELTLYSTGSSTTPQDIRYIDQNGTRLITSVADKYILGPGTQVEGGNWNGGGAGNTYVSWGRWSGTVTQTGGYINTLTNSQEITYPAASGFHYIVGELTSGLDMGNLIRSQAIYNFNLIGGTSPTLISNPNGTWFVTNGTLTANFLSQAISGNLGITTNQTVGFGQYNMTFNSANGALATASPSYAVNTSLIQTSGTLATCKTACSGSGNVSFYGPNAGAAGLSYDVNTGNNVLQGVAVFKR